MSIEVFVYIYMYICVCVVVFDFLFIYKNRFTDKMLPIRIKKLKQMLEIQCEFIKQDNRPNPKLQKQIVKKLASVSYLTAFSIIANDKQAEISQWVRSSADVFYELTNLYKKKPKESKAFFSYILSIMPFKSDIGVDLLSSVVLSYMAVLLVDFMKEESVYIRENAFKALLNLGEYRYVISAIQVLNETPIHQNEKLICDNLLTFKGDHEYLAKGLWKNFGIFTMTMQISFINYLRFLPMNKVSQTEYKPDLCKLLADKRTSQEVRLSIIRYFRKYQYSPAYPLLIEFVTDEDELLWEYAAVAASSLEAYPYEETASILENAIRSRNWYLRFNAAESLIAIGVDVDEMLENSEDLYANEMMKYRLQVRQQKRKENKTV